MSSQSQFHTNFWIWTNHLCGRVVAFQGRIEHFTAELFIFCCIFWHCCKYFKICCHGYYTENTRSSCCVRKHSKPTNRAIGERLDLAKSTVGRIAKMAESGKDVNIQRRGRCGWKRKTTASDDEIIIGNSVEAPRRTSRELQSDRAPLTVIIDPSTVRKYFSLLEGLQENPARSNCWIPLWCTNDFIGLKNQNIVGCKTVEKNYTLRWTSLSSAWLLIAVH